HCCGPPRQGAGAKEAAPGVPLARGGGLAHGDAHAARATFVGRACRDHGAVAVDDVVQVTAAAEPAGRIAHGTLGKEWRATVRVRIGASAGPLIADRAFVGAAQERDEDDTETYGLQDVHVAA